MLKNELSVQLTRTCRRCIDLKWLQSVFTMGCWSRQS